MVLDLLLGLHVHPHARLRHGALLHRPGKQPRGLYRLLATSRHLRNHPDHQRHAEELPSVPAEAPEELGLLASLDALTQAYGQVSFH